MRPRTFTKQVLNLLERNMKPRQVCKLLKCTPPQVYQIKYKYKKQIEAAKAKIAKAVPPKANVKDLKVGTELGGLVLTESSPGTYRWIRKGAVLLPPPPTTPKVDVVNHPPHYTNGGIEVIDFIESKGLGYRLGNVVKYVSRAGLKGNTIEDLRKAEWYLKREISFLERRK